MNDWNEHEVIFEDEPKEKHNVILEFAAAEGFERNETSVRVLDQDIDTQAQEDAQRVRMVQNGGGVDEISDFQRGLNLEAQIREDSGYKFLMMVSAFSARRLGKLVSSTGEGGRSHRQDIDNICAVVASPDKHWMQEPEISGVVFLSPVVFGHIKEAENIVSTVIRVPVSLNMLVENEQYATLFARLVAIRMSLSSMLSSVGQRLDGTFRRIHQEQHMILKALRCIQVVSRDWTRPNRNI